VVVKQPYSVITNTVTNKREYAFGPSKIPGNAAIDFDFALPPMARDEAFRKMMNNVSFTSNTFAVWLTIGFFEMKTDAQGNKTLTELFSEENRQIRHRMFAIVDRSQLMMPDSSQDLGVTVVSAQPSSVSGANYKIDVGQTLSGKVAGTFGIPTPGGLTVPGTLGQPNGTGLISMDWKFVPGGTIQIGSQIATITQVTPKGAVPVQPAGQQAATSNFLDVFIPTIAGAAPIQPTAGTTIRFPDAITMAPRPLAEFGVQSMATTATELRSLQYGYPGPQPRFSVTENQLVVPFYTIID
jgi:hypothetical protein